MSSDLFIKWLKPKPTTHQGVKLYVERPGARDAGLSSLKKLLAEHFVGEATIVQAGGYKRAAEVITNSLPSSKRTQSGDLGELLATEYVNAETPFVVPINKLRWKADRQASRISSEAKPRSSHSVAFSLSLQVVRYAASFAPLLCGVPLAIIGDPYGRRCRGFARRRHECR